MDRHGLRPRDDEAQPRCPSHENFRPQMQGDYTSGFTFRFVNLQFRPFPHLSEKIVPMDIFMLAMFVAIAAHLLKSKYQRGRIAPARQPLGPIPD